jgi:hypothetical protein
MKSPAFFSCRRSCAGCKPTAPGLQLYYSGPRREVPAACTNPSERSARAFSCQMPRRPAPENLDRRRFGREAEPGDHAPKDTLSGVNRDPSRQCRAAGVSQLHLPDRPGAGWRQVAPAPRAGRRNRWTEMRIKSRQTGIAATASRDALPPAPLGTGLCARAPDADRRPVP